MHSKRSVPSRLLPMILLLASLFSGAAPAACQNERDVQVFARPQVSVPSGLRLAVVVGIDEYSRLGGLQCAERDAEDIAQELARVGFTVARMRLDGKDGATRPLTAAAVLAQVDAVCAPFRGRTAAAAANPQPVAGTVLFYFSGHGFEDAAGRTFLCPFDTDPANLEGTALPLDVVHDHLRAAGIPRRLLVVDMCRNEPGRSGEQRTVQLARFQQAQGSGFLFATAPGSRSYEPMAGMRDERGVVIQNGLFTHFLLRGLRGEADGSRSEVDGCVTFREVAYFVADGLARLSVAQAQYRQVPYLRWDGTAEDVLLRVLEAAPPRPAAAAATADHLPPEPTTVGEWAEVLEKAPDPAVVVDLEARLRIVGTGLPWRVRDRRTGLVMLLVPRGKFVMGAGFDDASAGKDEPAHPRQIRRSFYLGESELRREQWGRVLGAAGVASGPADDPVVQVAEEDLQRFLQQTGLRLPSEAEWEYACRAGTSTPFWSGTTWKVGTGPVGASAMAGAETPNPWGFRGMHGGVLEWCADAYGPYPLLGGDERPAISAAADAARVLRGGSFAHELPFCRSAARHKAAVGTRREHIGVRVARWPQ